jgi:hypothetical protein
VGALPPRAPRLWCILVLAASLLAPAPATASPLVTIVVHVPLAVPDVSSAPPDAQCAGDTRTYRSVPLSPSLLHAYESTLHEVGTVQDLLGFGTWSIPGANADAVNFEADDHIFVRATLPDVRRVLPPLLRRMRRELHQQEILAEVFETYDPSLGKRHTRISVTVPYARAIYPNVAVLHRIFDDGGRSGASQYDGPDGVHIYSSVALASVARIEKQLLAADFPYATEASTFVAVDAPKCSH